MASNRLEISTLQLDAGPSIGSKTHPVAPVPKGFRKGTHRTDSPDCLLSVLRDDLERFGITRVGRLTGLDRIGVEVFAAVRPNARGLSVAQGKGCTRDAAELSGIMEAVELWHAENPEVHLVFGTRDRIPHALDREALDHFLGRPLGDALVFWCDGIDLISGQPVAVPFDLVHACFTDDAQVRGAKFPVSTNGLASGANRTEALIHGLCEVVERHDTATLARFSPQERAARILDLDSVDDPVAAELLTQFRNADIAVRVWDSTGKSGIASCVAAIADLRDPSVPPGFGAGCHASPSVALCRALSEAAQSRLTRISGARDDLLDDVYGPAAGVRARWLTDPVDSALRTFAELPDHATDRLDRDLDALVAAVAAAGHEPVVGVDLSDDPRFAVVRVVVPGLFGYEVSR